MKWQKSEWSDKELGKGNLFTQELRVCFRRRGAQPRGDLGGL